MSKDDEKEPTIGVDNSGGNTKPVTIADLINELIVTKKDFVYRVEKIGVENVVEIHAIYHLGFSAPRNKKSYIKNSFGPDYVRFDTDVSFVPFHKSITKKFHHG